MSNFSFIIPLLLFIAIIACALLLGIRYRKTTKTEYDEYQKTNHLKGYKTGYFLLIAYMTILYFITLDTDKTFLMQKPLWILLGILISSITTGCVNIWNNSYFSISQLGSKRSILKTACYFFVASVLYLVFFLRNIINHELITDGLLNTDCTSLMISLSLLIFAVNIVIKYIYDKRQNYEES